MSAYTVMPKQSSLGAPDASAAFTPARMIEVELGQPWSLLTPFDEKTGHTYRRARCLVRLHSQPLGEVELSLSLDADEQMRQIWQALGDKINDHLRRDGLPTVTSLGSRGLPASLTPRCIEAREEFLRHAPFISVIVPTRDRPEKLHNCLRNLLAQHYPHYEIIVVDNAPSTTATADLLEQQYQNLPQVRYVREDHPGIPWARNCGMMAAHGELLAFTDDDVIIDTYWLAELAKAFSVAEDVACVTGHVLPAELETEPQDWLEQYGGYSKGFARRIFDMAEYRPSHPLYPYLPGSFGTGANMTFRADYIRAAGGFATTLENQGSDVEALFQVVVHGHKLVYEPAALVRHFHYRSYERLRKQIYRYGMGLTALLTKRVVDHPQCLFDLVARMPYGFFFVLSNRSTKNRKKRTDYPGELSRIELRGMLCGPFVYLYRRLKASS